MASCSFRVAPEELMMLAERIDAISSGFAQAEKIRWDYSGYADATAVDGGLHRFFNKWSDGMDKIHKELDGLSGHLKSAAQQYQETDDEIAQQAGHSHG